MTTTKCSRCRRVLTSAKSIAKGAGRVCRAKLAAEARVSPFKPAQVIKAQELIADGGIVAVKSGRAFKVVSTDGTKTYLTAKEACNCPAGLKANLAGERVCYHRVAAVLLSA